MILKTLLGMSLALNVSLEIYNPPQPGPATRPQMSVHRKDAALLPLIQRATACIVRAVTRSSRYRPDMRPNEINDLIVDVIPACAHSVRVMIDAHDRMYGIGSGEAFVLGPYLDLLPAAIVQAKAPHR
jgi:hypothetical protein